MKDRAMDIYVPTNPFEKVKGHTRIELTDIHTGKKQIIEHDNDFQAGVLAKYMRPMGAFNNNPYANSTWAGQPIWRNLCGGILCFRDPIDNSEDEVEYMPAGNEMVANGAYMVNNAGTPIELGSYNEVESSTSGNDSVTFVYDWMTSQGNGTISCVCLTTEIGGYIGYGNPSGASHSTKKSFSANQSSRNLTGFVMGNYAYHFTALDTANKTLTYTKTPVEITKGSIFDNLTESTETITYTGNNPSWYMSAQDAIPIGNGKCIVVCMGGYYINWQFVTNGAVFTPFIVVDLINGTAHSVTLTNTTGVPLHICTYGAFGLTAIDENYACFHGDSGGGGNNHTYRIKYTQSTDTWTDMGEIGTTGDQRPGIIGGIITPNILRVFSHVYDEVNDTVYPINGSQNYIHYNPENDTITYTDGAGRDVYNGTSAYKNPLILATINNLATPVTKTAAQTMKITYTLTKASE